MIATLVVASMAPAAIAADEATTEAVASRTALSVRAWLGSLLPWLNGILIPGEREGVPASSTYGAALDSGAAEESSEEPDIDVSPQGGPDIDPDG